MIFMLIPAIVLFCVLALNPSIQIMTYSIKSNIAPLRIAVVSDIHSQCRKSLIPKLRVQKPDLILLPGDIVDDRRPSKPAFDFLKEAARIAPTYYVIGNHEVRIENLDEVIEHIKLCGVVPLQNTYTEIEINGTPFVIAGIDDPYHHKNWDITKAMEREFQSLPSGYRILLAHRPEQINKYLPYSFNLVVSGHAHGGQVRIPYLLNGVLAPHAGLFPKYAGGSYQHENSWHVVSRGIYYHPFIPRVFNRPEITMIKIEKG